VFLGDSITDFWRTVPWEWERFSRFHPVNAGIAWDQIQHVLWRVENGELDGISPKVIVLEVGTNNLGLGHDDPDLVARGVRNLIDVIHAKQPSAKILLLGIFPRYDLPLPVAETNDRLPAVAHGNTLTYLDCGSALLLEDFPDHIHPGPDGYRKWADTMLPTLERLYASGGG
jgi:beta-glucosidase